MLFFFSLHLFALRSMDLCFSFYFEIPVSAWLYYIGQETHYGNEQDFLVGNAWYQYAKIHGFCY